MTERQRGIIIFGEVLFDCFPGGERVLGGAPFNVAWHLHFLGDNPLLVSRVGADEPGEAILARMGDHGMDRAGIQRDPDHPTGRVEVSFEDGEPRYDICRDSAFDFIVAEAVGPLAAEGMLYHGSLALRNDASRAAFDRITRHHPHLGIFIDVNLRAPWWDRAAVLGLLAQARWCKLNQHELRQLGFDAAATEDALAAMQARFGFEQLILTRGEAGAMVLDSDGNMFHMPPDSPARFVDTVGAGDAFSAVYLHGLLAGWPPGDTLRRAQQFASRIIGIRGATAADRSMYRDFSNQ